MMFIRIITKVGRGVAAGRSEAMDPEHLVVVVVDQGGAVACDALARLGVDAETLRVTALCALGTPVDHPPVPSLGPPICTHMPNVARLPSRMFMRSVRTSTPH